MAPEILSGGKYKAIEVDLFALAVILFILVTGLPPFMHASRQDPQYRYIAAERLDLFWVEWIQRMKQVD